MIRPLLASVQAIGNYTANELELLEKETRSRQLAKDEFLLRKGEVCQSFFFILRGAVYQYGVNEDQEQSMLDLHTPNDWVIHHKSFTSQKPSESYSRAYRDCHLLEITITSLHKLIAESPAFFQMGRLLEQSTARMDLFNLYKTPDERYQYLLKSKSAVVRTFPQKMIASYLGMTPETLSRVRNRIR